jgi:light-regulated signal transduction histidine kinase (bacteriophytochrome)
MVSGSLQGVQPHGALIVVEPDRLDVLYVSENAGDILGIHTGVWVGGTLEDILLPEALHDIKNLLRIRSVDGQEAERGRIKISDRNMWLCVCQMKEQILLQFEPMNEHDLNETQALRELAFLMERGHDAATVQELYKRSSRMLRAMTGYDRILFCAFEGPDQVSVVAEATSGDITSLSNRVLEPKDLTLSTERTHLVANINADAVNMRKSTPDLPDIDLSCAHLQSPRADMRVSMRDLGISAFWTQPVASEEGPWGLIAMQHERPRLPSPQLRNVIRLFALFFEPRLRQLQAKDRFE